MQSEKLPRRKSLVDQRHLQFYVVEQSVTSHVLVQCPNYGLWHDQLLRSTFEFTSQVVLQPEILLNKTLPIRNKLFLERK